MSTAVADPLSSSLQALADPTRRAIVARLAEGDATVNELAAPFDMSLPAITKHLKVLERAGLLTRSRDAQRRPCHLRPEGFRPAADWLERYRVLWEQRMDRMADYVERLARDEAAAEAAPAVARTKTTRRARTAKAPRRRSI